MHIAHVVPAGAHAYTGVLTSIVQLSVHLARIGHKEEVWLLRPWGEEAAGMYGPALAQAGVALVAPRVGDRLALAARAVDVVHLHSVRSCANAVFIWVSAVSTVGSVRSTGHGILRSLSHPQVQALGLPRACHPR
jgi:hypothetical protein